MIAGRLRGRRLRAPAAPGRSRRGALGRAPEVVRPTSDRARAGLFDSLGPSIEGTRVLDLFAGTGALGIEALSRGAANAVFVERNPAALRALAQNLEELELRGCCEVLELGVEVGLRRLAGRGRRFELILADPPWDSNWAGRLFEAGGIAPVLAAQGLLVIEQRRRNPENEAQRPGQGLALRASRRYGETCFDCYEWEKGTDP